MVRKVTNGCDEARDMPQKCITNRERLVIYRIWTRLSDHDIGF